MPFVTSPGRGIPPGPPPAPGRGPLPLRRRRKVCYDGIRCRNVFLQRPCSAADDKEANRMKKFGAGLLAAALLLSGCQREAPAEGPALTDDITYMPVVE